MITKTKSLSLSGNSRVLGCFKTLISFLSNVSASPLLLSSDVSEANYSGNPETKHQYPTTCHNKMIRKYYSGSPTDFSLTRKTSRMTHYGFASQCRARHAFLGRSMIEMLGVLAVIGVLSVGGIIAFNKAMEEWRINKVVGEYSELMQNMLRNADTLRTKSLNETNRITPDILEGLDLLPANWWFDEGNMAVWDSADNMAYVYVTDFLSYKLKKNNLVINTFFKRAILKEESLKFNIKVCSRLFSNVIIPNQESITLIQMDSKYYDGNKFCVRQDQKCIKNMTMTDINQLCGACLDDRGFCDLLIFF